MEPIVRASARVLPVSPDGAVLLLRELDPAHPDEPYWSSIGGGIDPGESAPEAAVRELMEEAGIEAAVGDLIGPVLVDERLGSWAGVERMGHHTYFALLLDSAVPICFDGLQPEEVDTVLSARWWRPADLTEAGACRPPELAELVRVAVTAVEGAS